MALLGDTVLKLTILRDWFESNNTTRRSSPLPFPFHSYPDKCDTIEVAHDLSSSIGSNENLIQCAGDNNLERFINRNNSFSNREIPPRTMSTTVEALIGAVFVDSGESLSAVKVAMRGLGQI
jgi:ribonuclease-3